MRNANDAGPGVGKQDGRTISGDDAQGDGGSVRHHRIGARAAARGPWQRHLNHIRAMHLLDADETLGSGADRSGGASTVRQYRIARVPA